MRQDRKSLDQDRERIEAMRERHVGRLLLQAQRAFNARAIDKLRTRGYAGLTVSHTALLPHIDLGGTRITTLAERTGMTKQGMGQLVSDLERQGFLERAPDPADGRATLIRFTEAGWRYLQDAYEVKVELESEYAEALGMERFAALCDALAALIAAEQHGNEGQLVE
jgi:DNA-binding MarR family transcriptional regulator